MKQRSIQGFLVLLFTVLALSAGRMLVTAGVHRSVQAQVCDLVQEKYFDEDPEFWRWVQRCRAEVEQVRWWWSRTEFMKRLQWRLDELEVSHLMVYDPTEDRRLWHGESVDTGLRAHWIDGHAVVRRVLPQSPAEKNGLQQGDHLVRVNSEPVRSMWQVQTSEGWYEVERHGPNGVEPLRIYLQPQSLVVDGQPTLRELPEKGAAWLEISSFRSEYFAEEAWRELSQKFSRYRHLIVDLRDNSGGNLVAMLRALSPFWCQEQLVGHLDQPRKALPDGPPPEDNLDDRYQIGLLEKYRRLPLKTFATYGCYQGRVTVLVDQGTASVAEIFAYAFFKHPRGRVWGAATAGDVLLATWYALPQLGRGYSLSIPEALYLGEGNTSLEGAGVWPQKELRYKLDEALSGLDSWLEAAQREP